MLKKEWDIFTREHTWKLCWGFSHFQVFFSEDFCLLCKIYWQLHSTWIKRENLMLFPLIEQGACSLFSSYFSVFVITDWRLQDENFDGFKENILCEIFEIKGKNLIFHPNLCMKKTQSYDRSESTQFYGLFMFYCFIIIYIHVHR